MHLEEGQVWEYRTRRGEERSLVKIQRIETDPETGDPVFHISIIGLRCTRNDVLPHAPVSKQSLEKSLTRQASGDIRFPDPEVGIGEWRSAHGGVYSISLAEIVELSDFDPAGAE